MVLSSDALRGAHGHPFARMQNALESALAHGKLVVLDSTGMSYRFRALAGRVRERAFHVGLYVDPDNWRQRERARTDRAPLDEGVYRRSLRAPFAQPPDLHVDTSLRRAQDVAELVAQAWRDSS